MGCGASKKKEEKDPKKAAEDPASDKGKKESTDSGGGGGGEKAAAKPANGGGEDSGKSGGSTSAGSGDTSAKSAGAGAGAGAGGDGKGGSSAPSKDGGSSKDGGGATAGDKKSAEEEGPKVVYVDKNSTNLSVVGGGGAGGGEGGGDGDDDGDHVDRPEIVDDVIPANIDSLNCAARAHFEVQPDSLDDATSPHAGGTGLSEFKSPPEPAPRAEHSVSYKKSWKLQGEWKGPTAGGRPSDKTWSRNPQICVMAKPGTWSADTKTKVYIAVKQNPQGAEDSFNDKTGVGVYVLQHDDRQVRKFGSIGRKELVANSNFAVQKLVTLEVELPHPGTGSFLIVPCMYEAGAEGQFEIEITTEQRELFVQMLPPYHEVSFDLEWGAHTAGGCASFQTWRSNPQVEFQLTVKPTRIVAQLEQLPEDGSSLEPIGVVVCVGEGLGRMLTQAVSANTVGKTRFAPMPMNTCTLTASDPSQYVVVPSTFEAGKRMKFRLTLFSDEKLIAAPLVRHWPWRETYIDGEWTEETAGGDPADPVMYRRNPRFLLTPHSSLIDRSFLSMISITQECAEGETPANEMGFVVYRLGWLEDSEEPDWMLDADYALFRSRVVREKQIVTEVRIIEGPEEFEQLVLVPVTKNPGATGKFTLRVMYNAPVQVTLRAAPQWHRTQLEGSWAGDTAAGSANHQSWVRNPHFHVHPHESGTTAAYIFLRQADAAEGGELLNIGMYMLVKKGKAASAPFKIPFSPIKENKVFAEFKAEKDYWLVPATFVPKKEGSFTIEIFSNRPLTIDSEPTDGVVAEE